MSITVRRAGLEDLPALIALGRVMHAESLIPFPKIDETATRARLAQYERAGVPYFMALAEQEPGGAIGMITAQPCIYVFAEGVCAQHDIFYVRPEKRGSDAALKLVRAFEDWAETIGAREVRLAVHTGLFPDRTGRFYEKLGYRHMGGNFMKEID